MREVIDPKTIKRFEKLKESKTFRDFLTATRKKLGIPEQGMNPEEEQDYFYPGTNKKSEARIRNFESALRAIIKRFDLGKSLESPARAYLAWGNAFNNFDSISDYEFEDCGIDFSEAHLGKILFTVYPGATESGVKKILHTFWKQIDSILRDVSPLAYKKRLKNQSARKEKLHRFLEELYVDGSLKYDGRFAEVNAKSYLKHHGINNPQTILEGFRQLNPDIPGIEGRIKVVKKYLKKIK